MIRLGLCCAFTAEPIRFRTTTASFLARRSRAEALAHLAGIVAHNLDALEAAFTFCAESGIGAFRVSSDLFPVATHPAVGWTLAELPDAEAIDRRLAEVAVRRRELGLRATLHPDQFVVPGSPREEVAISSLRELEAQCALAVRLGADAVNIHGGGAYGDKAAALERLRRSLDRLSPRARALVTLENDDRVYTPADLLPLCRAERVPLVYDVHHHRCRPDRLSVDEAFAAARETWDREPLVHVSSPREGWDGPRPERHHDFVSLADVPAAWTRSGDSLTVEVEAKAKERAVAALRDELMTKGVRLWPAGTIRARR